MFKTQKGPINLEYHIILGKDPTLFQGQPGRVFNKFYMEVVYKVDPIIGCPINRPNIQP